MPKPEHVDLAPLRAVTIEQVEAALTDSYVATPPDEAREAVLRVVEHIYGEPDET